MAKTIFIISVLLTFQFSFCQSKHKSSTSFSTYPEKGKYWLDLNLGLSFFSSNLSTLDEFTPVLNEKPNYFGILLQPKYQYFIKDKLSLGLHIGFGYEELYENNLDFNQIKQVYFTGLQTEYFFADLINKLHFSVELDAGIQYLDRRQDTSNLYFKSGLHLITSFLFKDNFVVFMKLSDIVSYVSSEDNFFYLDQGFSVNNTFRNFINFPQFGIRYNLF